MRYFIDANGKHFKADIDTGITAEVHLPEDAEIVESNKKLGEVNMVMFRYKSGAATILIPKDKKLTVSTEND